MDFNRFIVLLLALIGGGSTYLLAPALPVIAQTFAVSRAISQHTITLSLIGMTIATVIYGPLSDRWGRKRIILIGLATLIVSSILCFFTDNLTSLILFRFLQGLGEGAVVVASYAAVSDMYGEIRAAQVMSQRNLIVNCSDAIAPIIGGAIANYFSWQGIFFLLTILGIVLLLVVNSYFTETLKVGAESEKDNTKVSSNSIKSIITGYHLVIKRPKFLIYALIESIPFIDMWGTVTSLPFIFVNLGVEVNHYGFYVLISTLFYLAGMILNQFLVKRIKIDTLILTGALFGMFDIIPLTWNYITPLSPLQIACLWGPHSLGLAFIIGNAATKALKVEKGCAGAGSAVIVIMCASMGVFGIFFTGKFCHGKISLLFWITVSSSITTIILLLIARRKKALESNLVSQI